jgi:hypothetical protein
MSITLMAYPMAFLIAPKEVGKRNLKPAAEDAKINKNIATKNLKFIKVLTNITFDEIEELMNSVDCKKIDKLDYKTEDDLEIKWGINGKYAVGYLFGKDATKLQTNGEKLFEDLDSAAERNVRLIDSSEFFYYNYSTEYKNENEIYTALKNEGATQIYTTNDGSVIGSLNGQILKYHKQNNSEYLLEIEQRITILNIGLQGKAEGRNISYGLTDLKIQTNIKPEELKTLLYKANYIYYPDNSQTPLKNSNAILNWVLKDGYYMAEFSGVNNAAITKEAEILFRKLNTAAARDLRLINDKATTVYTYDTNYTDKGVLINTLTEHGAQEITEIGDEISCKLFDMEMIYYKKENSNGYTLDITHITNKSECEELMQDLNDEYGLNIQEITYNKIKERLTQEELRLESEEVLEDESIVLTIEV